MAERVVQAVTRDGAVYLVKKGLPPEIARAFGLNPETLDHPEANGHATSSGLPVTLVSLIIPALTPDGIYAGWFEVDSGGGLVTQVYDVVRTVSREG